MKHINTYLQTKLIRVPFLWNLLYKNQMPRRQRIENLELLKRYKDAYAGKRCFVIGNGPSLTSSDLDMIKDEICFGANKIFKIYHETQWRPTFVCIQDWKILDEMSQQELEYVAERADCIFMPACQYYNNIERGIESEKTIYIPRIIPDKKKRHYRFKKNVEKGFMDGSTVTYMSMQIAAYMGFKEIYLLGVDHNAPYRKDNKGHLIVNDLSVRAHFYQQVEDNYNPSIRPAAPWKDAMDRAYKCAELYSRKTKEFFIYNATRGGCLEEFKRVDLDTVMRKGNGDR